MCKPLIAVCSASTALMWGLAMPAWADDAVLVHVVEPGDTLIGLSQRLLRPGTDWRALQRANAITQPRRLVPGSRLRIPLALLREQAVQAVQAEVLHTHGEVSLQRPGAPAQRLAGGESLAAGDWVTTGPQSSTVLRFADGARVLLRADSRLRIEHSMRQGGTGAVETRLQLEAGAADAQVPPPAAPPAASPAVPRFQIRTPVANLGVRGTEFRTRSDAQQTVVEVLEGRVAASTASAASSISTPGTTPRSAASRAAGAAARPGAQPEPVTAAGFGTTVSAQGVQPPRPLPPAPDLGALPQRIERLPLRLAWGAPAGGGRARAQVFEADAPHRLVLDGLFDAGLARWADDLPDGRYLLRVRSVDGAGLEGHDSSAAFTLKARPEPPFLTRPRAGERSADDTVVFGWTRNAAAARYRLQVADSAGFANPRIDRDDITADELRLPLPVGTHHWRLASLRANGDTGPWSDAAVLTRVALPPAPANQPPQPTADGVLLAWPEHPGARYQVQVAADAGFAHLLHDAQANTAQWLLRAPEPGQYFVRVRSIDADGFVGPYSAVQQVEVPRSRLWWLLAPAALLLLLL